MIPPETQVFVFPSAGAVHPGSVVISSVTRKSRVVGLSPNNFQKVLKVDAQLFLWEKDAIVYFSLKRVFKMMFIH
jgi:hypothetical protein